MKTKLLLDRQSVLCHCIISFSLSLQERQKQFFSQLAPVCGSSFCSTQHSEAAVERHHVAGAEKMLHPLQSKERLTSNPFVSPTMLKAIYSIYVSYNWNLYFFMVCKCHRLESG